MPKSTVLLFAILIHYISYSQTCLPEGYNFSAQFQIDHFHQSYPNCKKIEGPVVIRAWASGNNITNLLGLSPLTSFGSHVSIVRNENLSSLAGLDSINNIDSFLFILEKPELSNLDELNSLATIGNALNISGNNNPQEN